MLLSLYIFIFTAKFWGGGNTLFGIHAVFANSNRARVSTINRSGTFSGYASRSLVECIHAPTHFLVQNARGPQTKCRQAEPPCILLIIFQNLYAFVSS